MGIRQRLILPGRLQPSTFSTEGLNFCVRNGNRWDPFVMTTGNRIFPVAILYCVPLHFPLNGNSGLRIFSGTVS